MRSLWILLLLSGAPVLRAGDQPSKPGDSPAGEAALFGDMPVVETASLHAQTLADAPASVTVITAEDIRKYGYRTLGDVLASARGFTVASNRISQSSGVRGFAVPGDYNTCFLVMINGHPMTEIAADSNGFFGQDFGLDLDIVERIEIIRGPSSALYGSNGILATINLITKTPAESPHWSASTETGFGAEQKAVLMGSFDLGRGANLLVEGSGFYTGGQNLLLPGLDSLAPNDGVANHVDAQGGYHSFVNLQWGGWNFTSYFNNHRVRASILGDGTEFNDQGQFVQTARNFAGRRYGRLPDAASFARVTAIPNTRAPPEGGPEGWPHAFGRQCSFVRSADRFQCSACCHRVHEPGESAGDEVDAEDGSDRPDRTARPRTPDQIRQEQSHDAIEQNPSGARQRAELEEHNGLQHALEEEHHRHCQGERLQCESRIEGQIEAAENVDRADQQSPQERSCASCREGGRHVQRCRRRR